MTEKKFTRSNKYEEKKLKEIKEIKEINIDEVEDEENSKEHPLLKKILIYSLIFIIIFITYCCIVEPSFIDIKEYKVESPTIPDSFHGFKIVHFSDIHYGTTINKNQLDKIVSKINELKPDVIFFTGDLIDKNITTTPEIEEELKSSLSKLECTLYKYAIYGNEDYNNDKYQEIITSADFYLLDNESKLLYYKDITPIEITGYNSIETKPNYTILTNMIDEIDTTNFYKIVLTHEPDSIDNFINYNPNLVLSGHSLGGLIKFPFLKPLFLQDNSKKYYDDYYKINSSDIYISSGLGTSGINARFNNHPSINFYRIYKVKESN